MVKMSVRKGIKVLTLISLPMVKNGIKNEWVKLFFITLHQMKLKLSGYGLEKNLDIKNI